MSSFFISDTHFRHDKIRRACNRPYLDIDEMDEALISNWNNKVGKKDDVYHLGDFSWKGAKDIVSRLNGRIHLVLGNHDDLNAADKSSFVWVKDYYRLKIDDQKIVLFHYPIHYWDCCHYGSWHLFGHVHGVHTNPGKSKDVGVDMINYTPISYEELKPIMEELPQHVDYSRNRWPD